MMRPRILLIPALLSLASCASAPSARPATSNTTGIVMEPSLYQSFEEAHRAKARTLEREQRWAEAAAQWEILTLVAPDNAEYRDQLREAHSRISKGVQENLASAEDARQRGDVTAAREAYLRALSLEPENSTAIERLRKLEQEAYRRRALTHVVHQPKDAAASRPVSAIEHRDVEFAVLLVRQADYNGSITALEKYLKGAPKDDLARRYLADAHFLLGRKRLEQGNKEDALVHLEAAKGTQEEEPAELQAQIETLRKAIAEDYYQKGVKVYRANLDEAIGYWQRTLQYEPAHPQASAKLQRARQMQQNLKAIESGQQ
jgi:TolA-binding protein